MKIITDEKPMCCKENEDNLKYNKLAVKKNRGGLSDSDCGNLRHREV